jgi:hypothetical protein
MNDLIDEYRVRCRFESPFHSTARCFGTFYRCTPFISGATLRGALAGYLVQLYCESDKIAALSKLSDPEDVASYHRDCAKSDECPAAVFFSNPPEVYFSFGFPVGEDGGISEGWPDNKLRVQYRTPSNRSTKSIVFLSEPVEKDEARGVRGSLAAFEVVLPPARFDFEVKLLGRAKRYGDVIKGAVKEVGRYFGIGRLRSLGFGQFVPEESNVIEEEPKLELSDDGSLALKFESPLILDSRGFPTEPVREWFWPLVTETAERAGLSVPEENPITGGAFNARLDWTGRFYYSAGLHERFIAPARGSVLNLEADRGKWTEETANVLAAAVELGVGQWTDCGFGRFEIAERK